MGENGVIRFCSTVMQYVRASASDYDDWKTVHGNPGWGSDDLIPLLKKVSWVLVVELRALLSSLSEIRISYG